MDRLCPDKKIAEGEEYDDRFSEVHCSSLEDGLRIKVILFIISRISEYLVIRNSGKLYETILHKLIRSYDKKRYHPYRGQRS